MLSTLSSPGNLDLLRITHQERPASLSQHTQHTVILRPARKRAARPAGGST